MNTEPRHLHNAARNKGAKCSAGQQERTVESLEDGVLKHGLV